MNDILERLVRHRVGQIESIDVSLLDPFLQNVGDGGGRADDDGPDSTNSAPLREILDGPGPVAAREILDERMDGVRLLLLDDVGRIETTKIDAAPTRHENEREMQRGVALVILELGLGFGVGLVDDNRDQIIDENLFGIAAGRSSFRSHIADIGLQEPLRLGSDKDAFSVARRERFAGTRRARLIENRRALRRRFAQMIAGHVEVFSLVPDLVDLLGMSENAACAIPHNRAVLPAALEQLVEDFDIFLSDLVAIVVSTQAALPDVFRATLKVGGDDIPADAALRQVVGGREASGERIRMLKRG